MHLEEQGIAKKGAELLRASLDSEDGAATSSLPLAEKIASKVRPNTVPNLKGNPSRSSGGPPRKSASARSTKCNRSDSSKPSKLASMFGTVNDGAGLSITGIGASRQSGAEVCVDSGH